jgi:hypothetical protein
MKMNYHVMFSEHQYVELRTGWSKIVVEPPNVHKWNWSIASGYFADCYRFLRTQDHRFYNTKSCQMVKFGRHEF